MLPNNALERTVNKFAIAAFLVVGASCVSQAAEKAESPWNCDKGRAFPSKEVTRLKHAEAVALATVAAKNEGWDLSKYRHHSTCYSVKPRPEWTVFFESRAEIVRPGDHFTVWVRDDNRSTKIMAGE
ncbi:hypothetical protein BWI17_02235 [Betaproteobacteria bacterium GR16-43]|nr:hypothetical protein BWI17_02235 [Betaproteobacteria bacterium GR16-43]